MKITRLTPARIGLKFNTHPRHWDSFTGFIRFVRFVYFQPDILPFLCA